MKRIASSVLILFVMSVTISAAETAGSRLHRELAQSEWSAVTWARENDTCNLSHIEISDVRHDTDRESFFADKSGREVSDERVGDDDVEVRFRRVPHTYTYYFRFKSNADGARVRGSFLWEIPVEFVSGPFANSHQDSMMNKSDFTSEARPLDMQGESYLYFKVRIEDPLNKFRALGYGDDPSAQYVFLYDVHREEKRVLHIDSCKPED